MVQIFEKNGGLVTSVFNDKNTKLDHFWTIFRGANTFAQRSKLVVFNPNNS